MLIEDACEHACIGVRAHLRKEKCFPCDMYEIAHVGTASCTHKEWDAKVRRIWKEIGRDG